VLGVGAIAGDGVGDGYEDRGRRSLEWRVVLGLLGRRSQVTASGLLGAGSRSAGGKLFCAFVASLEMRRW